MREGGKEGQEAEGTKKTTNVDFNNPCFKGWQECRHKRSNACFCYKLSVQFLELHIFPSPSQLLRVVIPSEKFHLSQTALEQLNIPALHTGFQIEVNNVYSHHTGNPRLAAAFGTSNSVEKKAVPK